MGGRAGHKSTIDRYVALLRGINVGGKNIIKMDALRACFEGMGFGGVASYIQSGNVVFAAAGGAAALPARIEAVLADAFDYNARVALRSRRQMQSIIDAAPAGFGGQPDTYRYDVAFLIPPLAAADAIATIRLRDGVDTAWAGDGVLYFSRLTAKASMSWLSKLASLPIYQSMTIRNWNTTTRLLGMLGE